jgi:hypothetical protein
MDLEILKTKIEKMSKNHHIEILKILKKNANVKLNENKSGVYVNLSFLPKDSITEIENYLNYIELQETSLVTLENQKEEFKNTFFVEKEVKDEVLFYNSAVK